MVRGLPKFVILSVYFLIAFPITERKPASPVAELRATQPSSCANSERGFRRFDVTGAPDLFQRYVKEGERDFQDFIRLIQSEHPEFSAHMSKVHAHQEIMNQALIIVRTSHKSREAHAIRTKTFLTFASRLIDDVLGSPSGMPYHQLIVNRNNIDGLIKAMGPSGKVVEEMLERSAYRPAVESSILRMAYGGLIQRAPNPALQQIFLDEYRTLSLKGVDPKIQQVLRKVDPVVFWATTKTVLEQMHAEEPFYRRTLSELWNIIYAPMIYFQDNTVKAQAGELNFHKLPSEEDFIASIDIVVVHLKRFENERFRLRIDQFEFALRILSHRLPAKLKQRYEQLATQLRQLRPQR